MSETKTRFYLALGIFLCAFVFLNALNSVYWNKATYTVEVYEIFEVTHPSDSKGETTNVYTYGQCQFYFRGYHEINESKAYTFVYHVNQKRWRDLTLLDYWEITVLEREEN